MPAVNLSKRQIRQPDAKHRKALRSIIEQAQKTRFGTLSLDTRNPDHLLHLTRTFIGPKKAAPYFPQTQRLIEQIQEQHERNGGPTVATLFEMDDAPVNTFLSAAKILYCNVLPDGVTVVVGAVVTLLERPYSVSYNLLVFDNTVPGAIKNTGTIEVNNGTYSTPVTVQCTLPNPTLPVSIIATFTCVITPVSGGDVTTLTDTCIYEGVKAVQSLNVTDPTKTSGSDPKNKFIKVGLDRTASDRNDCDYYYKFGLNGSQPIVGVTLNGTATLNPDFSTASPPAFNGYLYLYRRDSLIGGGACIVYGPNTDFTSYVTNLQTSFTWNFLTNTFQGVPWDQNQTIDLDFFMQFALQQGGNASGTGQVRVTSIPTTYVNSPPPNIGPILPLQFVWGCLPAGTRVSTPDGDVAIETVEAGRNVYGGSQGRLMNVVRTWKGRETKPLIRATDERGLAVRLTSQHPVMTDTGLCMASELIVGTRVLSGDGSYVRLTHVEQVAFDGLVYNLDVEPLDGAESVEAAATFIADGFVVGDNRMQGECSRRALERLSAAPAEVPREWALDVENSARRAAGLPLTLELSESAAV